MGGSKPQVVPAPAPPYQPSAEATDFIARTEGGRAAFEAARAENPATTEDAWARAHYDVSKHQPGVYWGRTKEQPKPQPKPQPSSDWRSAASDAGWTPPPSAVPTVRDVEPSPSEQAAERRRDVAERKRVGRRGTIFTSSMGVSEEAPVQRKTLLGV